MCEHGTVITQSNVGMGNIDTANSNLDGTTGNYVSVFTAVSAGAQGGGSLVSSILIKAQVPVTQGMVRFFIKRGMSAGMLFKEVSIPNSPLEGGVGNTQPSFSTQFNVGLTLQPNDEIIASTQNSELFNIIVFGTNFGYCNCPE